MSCLHVCLYHMSAWRDQKRALHSWELKLQTALTALWRLEIKFRFSERIVSTLNSSPSWLILMTAYSHLIFDKEANNIHRRKGSIISKWCRSNWIVRRTKFYPYFSPLNKTQLQTDETWYTELIEKKVKMCELIGTDFFFNFKIVYFLFVEKFLGISSL